MKNIISELSDSKFSALLSQFKKAFISVAGFSFATNFLLLMPTIYMLQVYDRVLTSRNEFTLLMLSIITLAMFALQGVIELIRSKVLVRISSAIDIAASEPVFDASFRRYLSNRSGNPGQPLSDLLGVRQFLTGQGLLAVFDAPWAPIYLIVVALLNPWLGLFALCAVIIQIGLSVLNEKLTSKKLEQASLLSQAAGNHASASLRNAEAIEAMGMLSNIRKRWRIRQTKVLDLQAQASDGAVTITTASKFVRMTTQSGILGLGAMLVLDNNLTAGGMSAAFILLGRALSPIDTLINSWRSIISARTAYARLSTLMDNDLNANAQRTTLPRPTGAIAVENISITPPGSEHEVIKGVSFAANAGRVVAIIGPSASGKSSLARALVGVWHAKEGTLRLDGADISQWDKEDLGQWLGYLPQDVELLEGTIAENISRFGERDDEAIIKAAQRAGVHEMILRLPKGYETQIGEGGLTLSGGQRQRVGLARAMYGEPALIVLDEPNASLDEAGDTALKNAIATMKQEGRTVFVVTHRMNLVSLADNVLVLSNGALKLYGSRDFVLKALSGNSENKKQEAQK